MANAFTDAQRAAADQISRLLEQQGQIQAQGLTSRANIYGQTLGQIGQGLGNAIQQYPVQRLQQQRAQQELQIGQQTIASNQALEQERRAKLAADQRDQQEQDQFGQLMAAALKPDANGLYAIDPNDLLASAAKAGVPLEHVEKVLPVLTAMTATQEKVKAAHKTAIAQLGQAIALSDHAPEAAQLFSAPLVKNGVIRPDEIQPFLDQIKADPSSLPSITQAMMQLDPAVLKDYQAQSKPIPVAENARLWDPTTKQFVTQSAPPTPTEATMDAAAQALLTKQNMGQPLTTMEAAMLKAYQTRKTVVTDAAATAAANRQADTQGQQNDIQRNSQTFQMQQAGRKELTDKVEQPYQTAMASAQTLRDTVAAAQGGNKIGASLQSLETTMAAIRAQGLNRINTAEIGVPASAGNLWDRVQGWMGKASEGQPVPADIQKDMVDFAAVLEKSARKKYEDGFNSTTKRYGLKDEQMIGGAAPSAPAQTAPTMGEIRVIQGKRARWDGKGWLAIGGG